MRGAWREQPNELPELELLADDDDPVDDAASEDATGSGRRWSVAALGAGVVAALLVGLSATSDPEAAVEVLPTPPTTLEAPTTTAPGRGRPSTLTAVADGVFVSSERWEGVLPLDPGLGEATSVASGRGFFVVTFANGEARRYDRRGDVVGTSLGPGVVALEGPHDRRVVWLVVQWGDEQFVQAITDDDEGEVRELPGAPGIVVGPAARDVPAGWRVVGSTAEGFVLERSSGDGVALWTHWEGTDPDVLDDQGRFVASDQGRIAWARDGLLLQSEDEREVTDTTTIEGEVVTARYSPDGEELALLRRSNGTGRWVVDLVSRQQGLREVVVVTGPTAPRLGWSVQGELLVEPGSADEHRYDPGIGSVRRRARAPAG